MVVASICLTWCCQKRRSRSCACSRWRCELRPARSPASPLGAWSKRLRNNAVAAEACSRSRYPVDVWALKLRLIFRCQLPVGSLRSSRCDRSSGRCDRNLHQLQVSPEEDEKCERACRNISVPCSRTNSSCRMVKSSRTSAGRLRLLGLDDLTLRRDQLCDFRKTLLLRDVRSEFFGKKGRIKVESEREQRTSGRGQTCQDTSSQKQKKKVLRSRKNATSERLDKFSKIRVFPELLKNTNI